MLNSPAAREFIEKILEDTGGAKGLPDDVREEMISQMLHELNEMFNGELISQLNDEQVKHVEHLLDTNHQNDIEEYLTKQSISVAEVAATAMTRFKVAYQGM